MNLMPNSLKRLLNWTDWRYSLSRKRVWKESEERERNEWEENSVEEEQRKKKER